MSNKLEMRQAVINSLKYYLDKHHMALIPVGSVQRGPAYELGMDNKLQPVLMNGLPCIGIVFSVGLKGQEPPEWLMDIIKRIEHFAINELNKIESKTVEDQQT